MEPQTAPPEETLNLIPIYRNPKIQGGVLAGKYYFISSQILRNCQLQLNAKIMLYYTLAKLFSVMAQIYSISIASHQRRNQICGMW